ncbi:polygalacturonase [Colletotrichum cuscutae]|uniref:galacturonan 1,4-alpha-galacturonidase n=1 Tax=Colletotrichum cuscutae TaxID=1209917 RepID=A0AAI9Y4L6_9PEZI|nr:polygalacturonase [Colletotrichum cuscutae]
MVAPTLLGGLLAAALVPFTHAAAGGRPDIKAAPFHPGRAFPASAPRTKTCAVKAGTNGSDDSAAILQAFHSCNNGGTVVLDKTYTICNPLDLTFLNAVDVALTGTVNFCDDIDHWLPRTFKYTFQISSSMWKFGGKDVNIYGNGVGTLNGNGQKWWDRFASNATLERPILFVTDDSLAHSLIYSHPPLMNSHPPHLESQERPLKKASKQWFNLIANSTDVLISDINIKVGSTSSNPAKNTDGWDTYRSDGIVIQNSVINNGDDCVSFKPNSTNIVVQNLVCNGSHGISVGSLGQYIGTFDVVENLYVYNTSMSNASDGARIKVWPGMDTPFQPNLSGGGGSGYVKNVTYDTFHNDNNDNAITIDQCYGQKNQTICNQYPVSFSRQSNMTISDIYFRNFDGTVSSKNDPRVGSLVCSSPSSMALITSQKCVNINASKINVKAPSGKNPQWLCVNLDTGDQELEISS